MKARERTCTGCGETIVTCSKALRCNKCRTEDRAELLIVENRQLLEELYSEVEGPVLNKHKQRQWTFIHNECATKQTWTFNNILKQLKLRPDSIPCSKCGGKERMKPAMAAFIEKYGRDFDVALWEEYKVAARRMTERTYKANEQEINPLNLKRGVRTWHLDHKIPIIEGFLQGIPVEVIAAKENLQILPAFTNMSKGRKHESNTRFHSDLCV